MISANLPLWLPEVNLLIKSVIVLVSASILLKFTQKLSAAFRLRIWKVTFLFLACLPVFYFFPLANWEVFHSQEKITNVYPFEKNSSIELTLAVDQPLSKTVQPSNLNTQNNTYLSPQASINLPRLFQGFRIIWVIGILLLLGHLALDVFALYYTCKNGKGAIPSNQIDILATIKVQLNISRKVILINSSLINTPITFGLFRPIILLPSSSANWSSERFHMVIVHELSHIKNFDYASNLFVAFVKIMFWPNPLIWWASKKFRLETEINNDALVIKNGLDPITYASHLFEIASENILPSAKKLRAGLNLTRKSDLKERMSFILNSSENSKISPAKRLIRFGWILLLLPLMAVKLNLKESITPIPQANTTIVLPKDTLTEKTESIEEDLSHLSNNDLLKLLKDTKLNRKAQAALILGQRKERRALKLLLQLTHHKNLDVKENAILAIGYFQLNKTYYTIQAFHQHPDERIRRATLISLHQIGCLSAFRIISEHTNDKNPSIKLLSKDLLQSFDSKNLQDWLKGSIWNKKVENWLLDHFEGIRATGNLPILIETLVREQPEKRKDIKAALKELPNLQKLRKTI